MKEVTLVDSPIDMPLFSHKLLCDTRPQSSAQSMPTLETAGRDIAALLQDIHSEKAHSLMDCLQRATRRPVEDLENLLFLRTRDFYAEFPKWTFSLWPLVTVHPLIRLFPFQPPKVQARIERRLVALVELDPTVMQKYRWTLSMLDVVTRLAVYWEVIGLEDFRHREDLGQCLLQECADVKVKPILEDVIYLGASTVEKDSLLTAEDEKRHGVAVTQAVEQLIRYIVSLNSSVDFTTYPSILDHLYNTGRSSRIQPELLALQSDRQNLQYKLQQARIVGFHVLHRPSFWSRCCRQTVTQRANRNLERLLGSMRDAYMNLERRLATHLVT